jgi:hypothetical protein
VAAVVVALVGAGGALAYFTTTGSGTASGSVGEAQAVTISAGASPSTVLFPGTDGDVTVHISNPNTIPVHIGSLVVDTSQGTNGFSASPGCNFGLPTPALTFTTQTGPGGNGWTVPKKVGATDGTLDLDLTGSIHMNTNAANACQGATFTVFLQVGP